MMSPAAYTVNDMSDQNSKWLTNQHQQKMPPCMTAYTSCFLETAIVKDVLAGHGTYAWQEFSAHAVAEMSV